MNIYDFNTTDKLFFCGSMFGNEASFIKRLQDNMSSGIEAQIHPMEIERQKRLGKRRAKRGMTLQTPGSTYTTRGSGKYDNSVIIVAGGGGFGTKDDSFFVELFGKANELAIRNDSHIVIVRGCFDDPSYFNEKKLDFSNIHLVSDYSIVRMHGFDILCIGGGMTIDRIWRKEQGERLGKKLFFEGCETVLDKKLLAEALNNFKVTCIVTNDAPTFLPPLLDASNASKWAANDSTIISDMTEQRLRMDSIYAEIVRLNKKPYAWCYCGHGVDDSDNINNIKFLSSSSVSYVYNVQENIIDTFGFSLNGEKNSKPSKFLKKMSASDNIARRAYFDPAPVYEPAPDWERMMDDLQEQQLIRAVGDRRDDAVGIEAGAPLGGVEPFGVAHLAGNTRLAYDPEAQTVRFVNADNPAVENNVANRG